jgi:proteic killer suppression protein
MLDFLFFFPLSFTQVTLSPATKNALAHSAGVHYYSFQLHGSELIRIMINHFRDQWLMDFFLFGKSSNVIPSSLEAALARKLDIINAASSYRDLRSPPGNMYESLNPPLEGYSSIRVNRQYRLVFRWTEGKADDLYLSPHKYTSHK